jgi:ADP-heptose:LPS heptosyltransferase
MMKKEKDIFPVPDCRRFSGYKPCEPRKTCPCSDPVHFGRRILVVNLDFIGGVLMNTAMLPAIGRKYPGSTIHWITKKNAMPVLENNPFLHRVWEWNDESRMILAAMRFDTVLNADKNQNSCAFVRMLDAKEKLGFGLNENGAIIPLNRGAGYNYRMGVDDDLKFRKNRRTGLDILAETWDLDYRKDEYVLDLTEGERAFCSEVRRGLGIRDDGFTVGFNTGCSALYPLKKMTVDQHVSLIREIHAQDPGIRMLLLGGKEDAERNREIKRLAGGAVEETPVDEGLRRGILYENCCDLVVTGDSLGMHIAIGLKKTVIAWFGLSCGGEIELYGRGEKRPSDLDCSPCWKKTCGDPRCIRQLDLKGIASAVMKYRRLRAGGKGKF